MVWVVASGCPAQMLQKYFWATHPFWTIHPYCLHIPDIFELSTEQQAVAIWRCRCRPSSRNIYYRILSLISRVTPQNKLDFPYPACGEGAAAMATTSPSPKGQCGGTAFLVQAKGNSVLGCCTAETVDRIAAACPKAR